MCVEPTMLNNGELVGCRYCWQCRANRVNDLTGRCIAEDTNSALTLAVTLTYRESPENAAHAAVLVYADFQKFIKRLRYHGYEVRYIVAGEYGSSKGRAHWHAVLFFDGLIPEFAEKGQPRTPEQVVLDERINWSFWPHGYAFFQEPDYGGFAYLLKYALKDLSQEVRTGHLAMSKKPPLGAAFVQDLAEQYVEQKLAPQDLFYSFPDVFDANRKRRRFMLQGTSRENFVKAFIAKWEETYTTPHPISPLLEKHWDKLAAQEMAMDETDEHYMRSKAQWPKYVHPDTGHGEYMDEQFWWDDTNHSTQIPFLPEELYGKAPAELWELCRELDPKAPALHVYYPPRVPDRVNVISGRPFTVHGHRMDLFYVNPNTGDENLWRVTDDATIRLLRDWFAIP